MSWDTSAAGGSGWNDGGGATTSFNEPAPGGFGDAYGATQTNGYADEGEGAGSHGYDGGDGGAGDRSTGGCFNCGEEG